jgi:hypothetical protein
MKESELNAYCKTLDVVKEEVTFQTLRDSFRKICIQHHPLFIRFHMAHRAQLPPGEPHEGERCSYYERFQTAAIAYANLSLFIVIEGASRHCGLYSYNLIDTNTLHGKNRNAFNWVDRMLSPDDPESRGCGRPARLMDPEDIVPRLVSIQEQAHPLGYKRCMGRASKMLDVFISHFEQVDYYTGT